MEEEVEVPGKKSVFLMFLLSVITLGIYFFIWYMKRAGELNNLRTKSKLNKGTASIGVFIIIVLLVLCVVIGIFTISTYSQFATNLSQIPLPFLINLGLILFLGLVLLFMALFFAFRVRKIINQALAAKGSRARVSWFFTLLFNSCYLQYEINRVINDKEETKKVWPWFFLIFGFLLVALALIFGVIFIINNASYFTGTPFEEAATWVRGMFLK